MKKFLALILTFALCLSIIPAYAEEGDVSISFRLGDSTLMINGNPVEVETPYATDDGVTLVPLRVITEAFGATVDWKGEEQKIVLTYPDVNIVLQLNNRYAQINDHTEELPVAPTATENGVTMVPLRFISDAYGADVSWEDGLITVTKKSDTEYGDMVQGMADSEMIGDSYYGWVMKNPKSMLMSERDFDGKYTEFTSSNEDFIYIYVEDLTEDTDSFDSYYNYVKNVLSGMVLVRQDKLVDENGNQMFVIMSKEGDEYLYSRCYYTEDRSYEVIAGFTAEDNTQRDSFLAIVDSFALAPLTEDVYDLSDVSANGTRKFTDEKYKVSIDVPADYYEAESNENNFAFMAPEGTNAVRLSVYSKSETENAAAFAEYDNNSKKTYLNSDFADVSDITTEDIDGTTVYSYTTIVSGTTGMDMVEVDYFLENGDYIYNCTVSADTEEDARATFLTLKTETLDSDEIGSIIRGYGDNSENVTVKSSSWSFDIPGNWTYSVSEDTTVMATNMQSIMMFMYIPQTGNYSAREFLQELISTTSSTGYAKQVGNTKTVVINNRTYQVAVIKDTSEGTVSYTTIYVGSANGKLIAFILMENEILYNAGSAADLKRMMTSLIIK